MTFSEALPRSPRRKRRWFQYTLRALLAFVLLASIAMSWFAVKLQEAREQKKAVAAIRQAGGNVYYYDQESWRDAIRQSKPPGAFSLRRLFGDDLFDTVVEVDFGGDGLSTPLPCVPPSLLANVEHLHGLRKLSLVSAKITAKQIRQIGEVRSLEELDLALSDVPEDEWGRIEGLRHLTSLDLAASSIRDAALENIGGLSNLRRLDLSFTKITDAGLEHLRGLTGLQFLELEQCPITDAGLLHLAEMRELETLNLGCTGVTEAGWSRLRVFPALAELKIQCDNPSEDGIAQLQSLSSLQDLNICVAKPDTLGRLTGSLPNVNIGYDAYFGGLREVEEEEER